jgi:hypothetical protein
MGYPINIKSTDQNEILYDYHKKDDEVIPFFYTKKKSNYNKKILKCIHIFIISILISWSKIFAIFHSFSIKSPSFIGHSSFSFLNTIQYFLALFYFYCFNDFNQLINDDIIKKKINRYFKYSTILSLFLTVLNILSLFFWDGIKIYNTLIFQYNFSLYYLLPFIIIDQFLNFTSYLINISIFILTLNSHKNIINSYQNRVKECLNKSKDISYKISKVGLDFPLLKNSYEKSVKSLNNFFFCQNIFGFLGLFYFINFLKNGNIFVNDFINLFFFLIIEWFFIHSIKSVRDSVSSVKNYLVSPDFLVSIIGPKNEFNIELLSSNNNTNNTNNILNNLLINSLNQEESIKWFMFKDIVNTEWNNFTFFGIKIDDTALTQKFIGFITSFIIANDMAQILKF